jgi:hypothetical protein
VYSGCKGESEVDERYARHRGVPGEVVVSGLGRNLSDYVIWLILLRLPLFYVSVSGLVVIIDLLVSGRPASSGGYLADF